MSLSALIFPLLIHAAPYPMTSSSVFLDKKQNLFLWPFKIDLNLQRTSYEMDLLQNEDEKWIVKTPLDKIQVFVRLRTLGPKEDYDKSLKSWLREYEKSGFQIVAQQIPQKNADHGWIHLQDSHEKQLVQYFRYQNKLWVYFNCVGPKDLLPQIRQTCETLGSTLRFK